MGLFPKVNNKAIGDRSEAAIIARLIEVGYTVLTPFGDNSRYDLVIEDAEGTFWRVQCKTGRSNGECITFSPASSTYHTKKHGRQHYRGQIDYFAVYCAETRGSYFIPVNHVGTATACLRLVETKNKQERRVRWAKDYEL